MLFTAAAPQAQAFLPEKPLLLVELDGPARLAQAFAATDVGAMLAAKEAADFWPALTRFARVDAGEPEWLRPMVDALLAGVRSYGGRIRFAWAVEPPAAGARGTFDGRGVLVL